MPDRPADREAEFLRERAARLREIAVSMPDAIRGQLLDVAIALERRAAKLELDARRGGVRSP